MQRDMLPLCSCLRREGKAACAICSRDGFLSGEHAPRLESHHVEQTIRIVTLSTLCDKLCGRAPASLRFRSIRMRLYVRLVVTINSIYLRFGGGSTGQPDRNSPLQPVSLTAALLFSLSA